MRIGPLPEPRPGEEPPWVRDWLEKVMSEIQHADWEKTVREGKAPQTERGSPQWWDSVPDPEHPRHHEACSDDCEYKQLPEGHAGRQDTWPRPAPRPSRASLALAWMKGFMTAMAELKLPDWQKVPWPKTPGKPTTRPDLIVSRLAAQSKPLPVIFEGTEAWIPTTEAETGPGPYRGRKGLRRITPDEAALIAMQAAERARRFTTFMVGLTLANVLIQVLRLVFG